MYRSGLASVINNIPQPVPAYVSPRRVNNKLGCKRRTNERLVCQIKIYESLPSSQNFTWEKALISRGGINTWAVAMRDLSLMSLMWGPKVIVSGGTPMRRRCISAHQPAVAL